ncbi:MAG: FAD-dependent oxidoreductase [Pseudomonadales bacterium]|nr:FAD-dependent oxidoreductase [Pseudomonadales bacterium]
MISDKIQCCIVGAGPAGVLLSLLLARRGIHVHLLEMHQDLDRDFRGDTVHASTLEALEQIELADKVLEIPHAKMRSLSFVTPSQTTQVVQFGRLKTRFPYVAMMPQAAFLETLLDEARRYPNFQVSFNVTVTDLLEKKGKVVGVRTNSNDRKAEITADLVVACDGRFSRLRNYNEPTVTPTSAPMDVAWIRLPRMASDPENETGFHVADGKICVLLARENEWQIGYVFPKGNFREMRSEGIEHFRSGLGQIVPFLADRASLLRDFSDIHMLNVRADFVETWHQQGLLLLGDAAHAMSPVGGVGINFAIADAIEAANILSPVLASATLERSHLASIQRKREKAVRKMQKLQAVAQNHIVSKALTNHEFQLPLIARLLLVLPFIRDIPAKIVAFGFDHPAIDPDS